MGLVGRRRFLAGVSVLLAVPLSVLGQQADKVYQIGLLQSASSEFSGLFHSASLFGVLLAERGYVPVGPVSSPVRAGRLKHFRWIQRYAIEADEQLPALAAELVRLKVDIIVAVGTRPAMAARQATDTIPLVMLVQSDPVRRGLVPSLGRPGGNLTGVTTLAPQLAAKRLELLKETVPQSASVAVLWRQADPDKAGEWREIQTAAKLMGVELRSIDVGRSEDFASTLDGVRKTDADALLVLADRLTSSNAPTIAELAATRRLPAMYSESQFAEFSVGGLMYYGPVRVEILRQAAGLVAKILEGAKPSELPVEQPSKFELIVNLRTAKALGITIPSSILLRADRVIE